MEEEAAFNSAMYAEGRNMKRKKMYQTYCLLLLSASYLLYNLARHEVRACLRLKLILIGTGFFNFRIPGVFHPFPVVPCEMINGIKAYGYFVV